MRIPARAHPETTPRLRLYWRRDEKSPGKEFPLRVPVSTDLLLALEGLGAQPQGASHPEKVPSQHRGPVRRRMPAAFPRGCTMLQAVRYTSTALSELENSDAPV